MKCLFPTIIGLCILISCGTEPTVIYTLNTSVNGEGEIGYSVGDMERLPYQVVKNNLIKESPLP